MGRENTGLNQGFCCRTHWVSRVHVHAYVDFPDRNDFIVCFVDKTTFVPFLHGARGNV